MWKLLKISEQSYFIFCNFNDNTKDITFILYDFKITWCEAINLKDVKQKVKLLNKRFDFNVDNIIEALTSDAIHSAVLEDDINQDSCLLKLKYRVKNCMLSYEWCLKKQKLLEFQQTIVQPLLLTLLDCQQQIEILKDSVRKKDTELKQFRIEGAILNRKTLVTKPFDFEDFTKKFEAYNKTTNDFTELAKYVKETKSKVDHAVMNQNLKEEKPGKSIKPEENMREEHKTNIKMSPRQKKRKANEIKMNHLQQHLKFRRQGLEYESSQSQTPSSCSSQTIEEPEIKDLKQQKQIIENKQETSQSKNLLSPRKSTRSSTTKQKQEMSSEDKTDSDNEDYIKTFRQKRSARCLGNMKTSAALNSKKEDTKDNTKTNPPQETEPTKMESFNLSNNSQNSNIFDFIIESHDDIPLLKRKNKKEQGPQKQQEKTLKNNNSALSLSKSPVLDFASADSVISINSHSLNESLNQSSTPVIINEISSQLDNIKKELETLEKMRLADLQKRICKV